MASDTPGDASVEVNLPESLSRWLDEKASEEGRSREDVLLQLLSAYRKVYGLENGAVDLPEGMDPVEGLPPDLEADLEDRVEELVDERLAAAEAASGGVDPEQLNERVSAVESRFVDLLEDVRERVVQLKRETDAKAPAEHDHSDLAAAGELEALETDLEMAETAVDALESRMEAGFGNFETVLEHLASSIDRTSGRQTTLARALLETREELRKLAARDTARSAAEALKREASEHGVRSADCEECDTAVDVGLLTRAECPHCSAPFVGVEPAQGFFGSDSLATGQRPALEAAPAADDGYEHDVDDIIDDDGSARTGVQEELDGGDGTGAGTEGTDSPTGEGARSDTAAGTDGDGSPGEE